MLIFTRGEMSERMRMMKEVSVRTGVTAELLSVLWVVDEMQEDVR